MRAIVRLTIWISITVLACTNAPAQTSTFKAPPPRFTDPERRAKLAAAFPEIDAIFQEFVARKREQPAFGSTVDRVTGAAHPLQEGSDRAWRPKLANEIDIADIDAELERGGRHQRF